MFQKGIKRSRESWFKKVVHLFDRTTVDEALWDDLEELLITADVGVSTTTKLVARVRERASRERLKEGHQIYSVLKEEMVAMLKLDVTSPQRVRMWSWWLGLTVQERPFRLRSLPTALSSKGTV
jgi:signal recognition particle GTPase